MRVPNWIEDRLADRDMSRRDRRTWAGARTLEDLGVLTACWLRGDVHQTPTSGRMDPETRPYTDVLAAANLAGYVTDSSQPGVLAGWGEQAADVGGLARGDDADRLVIAAAGTALIMLLRRGTVEHCVPADGRRIIDGHVWAAREDIDLFYSETCPAAIAAVRSAWHVTICDPVPGRNDVLWPALARFAAGDRR